MQFLFFYSFWNQRIHNKFSEVLGQVNKQHLNVKFWNWGTTTIWDCITQCTIIFNHSTLLYYCTHTVGANYAQPNVQCILNEHCSMFMCMQLSSWTWLSHCTFTTESQKNERILKFRIFILKFYSFNFTGL